VPTIKALVEAFADGYEDSSCWGGPVLQTVTLAPAINNDNFFGDAALTPGHAQAWASMTDDILDYMRRHGYSNIFIAAGIDAEPGYSSYSLAKTWAKEFINHAHVGLYNFGSTDTYPCPATFPPPEPCDLSSSAW